MDNTGAQGSKVSSVFPVLRRGTAIDTPTADDRAKDSHSLSANDARAASSGGVGAVRRTPQLSRRGRALAFVAVLALFASGAGNSAPGFSAPPASHAAAGDPPEPGRGTAV